MTIWDAHASLSVETSNLTTKCDGWEMGIPSPHKFRSQMSYKDLDQEYPQENIWVSWN